MRVDFESSRCFLSSFFVASYGFQSLETVFSNHKIIFNKLAPIQTYDNASPHSFKINEIPFKPQRMNDEYSLMPLRNPIDFTGL